MDDEEEETQSFGFSLYIKIIKNRLFQDILFKTTAEVFCA